MLEAIAARHLGLSILGISCLSNTNLPDCQAAISENEIVAAAQRATPALGRLLAAVVTAI